MKILAIIPARGGSKGVPGKNSKEFNGKPLIQYAVDCAVESNHINKIIVDSDDQSILNAVDSSIDGERIEKHLRPKELGKDDTKIDEVVVNLIDQLQEQFDIIILLQVTSPIRTSKDISNILSYFKEYANLEGVISVVPMDDMHPARMYKIDNTNKLEPFVEDNESKHRQHLDPVYYRNGCFYAIRTKAFLEQRTFMPKNKKAYVMNPNHLLNIDAKRDVQIAETLISAWLKDQL